VSGTEVSFLVSTRVIEFPSIVAEVIAPPKLNPLTTSKSLPTGIVIEVECEVLLVFPALAPPVFAIAI
jgi:hypothetical protein